MIVLSTEVNTRGQKNRKGKRDLGLATSLEKAKATLSRVQGVSVRDRFYGNVYSKKRRKVKGQD